MHAPDGSCRKPAGARAPKRAGRAVKGSTHAAAHGGRGGDTARRWRAALAREAGIGPPPWTGRGAAGTPRAATGGAGWMGYHEPRPIRHSEASTDAKRRPARSDSGSAGETMGDGAAETTQGAPEAARAPAAPKPPRTRDGLTEDGDARARPAYRRRPPRGRRKAGRVGGTNATDCGQGGAKLRRTRGRRRSRHRRGPV